VVKPDVLPLVVIMTGFAFSAVPPNMDILDPVAIDAGCTDVLVALASMARRADNSPMRALEPKPGFVVIEWLDATP
jgi:hypothetical protein